jgi:RNA polymerase sigma factor (sigma-70 family)
MTGRELIPISRQLRQLLVQADGGSTSDEQLIRRFVNQRDEAAFELLVWRHGPMVHGVCRRVLRDPHHAEDAFQATLLVLARKARFISLRRSLASWLYKVAYRVALRARAAAWKRARHERQVLEIPAVVDPRAPAGAPLDELQAVLDEELNRLAEKHRSPMVLCYLQGLTNEEAARQLGWPVGTVKTRLAQARHLLAGRLARRGLAPAGGILVATASPAWTVAPPRVLVGATVRAAALASAGQVSAAALPARVACLMEGVLRAMMVTKVKLAALALAVGLAAAGAGTIFYRALAAEPAAAQADESKLAPPNTTAAQERIKRLKKELGELSEELRRAEAEAEREKALPPRKTPVAVIFGTEPITREELADYLLSHLTAEQLDKYVRRRVLEHACKQQGIVVTDDEVDIYIKGQLGQNNSQQNLRDRLREQKMTLRQWKEDTVRAQLLLHKLAQEAEVTESDLRREFEAQYGEKVECRGVVWPASARDVAEQEAALFRTGEADLEAPKSMQARKLNSFKINRTGTKERARLEKVAFRLRPGEISPLIHLDDDGGYVILQCLRRIPAKEGIRYEDVRESLRCEVEKRLRPGDEKVIFRQLLTRAQPKLLWTPPADPEQFDK